MRHLFRLKKLQQHHMDLESFCCKVLLSQISVLDSCLPCLVLKLSCHEPFPSNLSQDSSILTIREPPCCPGIPSFLVQGCEEQVSAGPQWAVLHIPEVTCGSRGFWPLYTLCTHPAGKEQAWKCGLLLLNTLAIISLLLHTSS